MNGPRLSQGFLFVYSMASREPFEAVWRIYEHVVGIKGGGVPGCGYGE